MRVVAIQLREDPLMGGIFERIGKSTKRSLRKIVGQARLNYDELLTVVTDIRKSDNQLKDSILHFIR